MMTKRLQITSTPTGSVARALIAPTPNPLGFAPTPRRSHTT
jgi:hypothetical protein